jgi:polar amino acid transport system substrate-binding protein
MATIKARGSLIAGVDLNSYHFGYLNPLNGRVEGFDIDMLHAISAAIFGNPNQIRYVSVSSDQRIPAIQSGEVDIVAHTMTITCDRLKQVDFSTVYLDPTQKVLVPRNSPARNLVDLAGKKVCAAAGSTSLTFIRSFVTIGATQPFGNTKPAIPTVVVPYWSDCLVLLEEGKVAAVSTDDNILAGLKAQDPATKIIGGPLASQPYGLAISQQHPDFVRFVNAVLAKMRADGQWAAIYRRWIGSPAPPPPPERYLVGGYPTGVSSLQSAAAGARTYQEAILAAQGARKP